MEHLSVAAILLLLAGCTLPADEGLRLRRELGMLDGRSAAPLVELLGEPHISETPDSGHRMGWAMFAMGRINGECRVEVTVDPDSRIVETAMTGSDYVCGTMVLEQRRQARLARDDPHWERRGKELLDELLRTRRALRGEQEP